VLWFILSMQFSIDIAAAGVVVAIGVYIFICKTMHYQPAVDLKMLRHLFLGLRYALLLVLETAKATFAVLRIVFRRKIEIDPRIIYFRSDLQSSAALVCLANSITLTPGTITVALDGNLFCVHCLTGKMAEGIEDSLFVQQLHEFEK
ncbi:MAG: Na+/H+ antiporter subunit E, partial [Clostridiales bacterium]|nr:Na+/H+ antiporter subunit E [Clostridiales bacterium]